MSRFGRIALAILVVVAVGGAYLWWSSPERQIRRVLSDIAEALSYDAPATALGAASSAASLQPYFAPDVTIEPGEPYGRVKGRDAVLAAAARLRSRAAAFRVEFVDLQVSLAADKRSARIDCTATATVQDGPGQESMDAREIMMTMNTMDGRWVITWARAVDVLEPVTR